MMLGWMIAGAAASLLAVLLTRAFLFKPLQEEKPQARSVSINDEKIVRDMQALIQCKTVSYRDRTLEDAQAFEEFPQLLKALYPNMHENLQQEAIGDRGLLYRWPGKRSDKPSVLMAHYDVVPVQEEMWNKPPFSAHVEDGILWGRGTLDTKGTLLGVMEAAEQLIQEGFVPENDLYLAFGGDEEINGGGAPGIVAELRRRGITPVFVLDEGGAVVEHVFPGVKEPCALIGIAEKGMTNIMFEINAAGGHASAPPPHTSVGLLARAVARVEDHPFPFTLTPAAKAMFSTLGRRSSFLFRLIFANLWCFAPLLDLLCKKTGGELNALTRTTCAFTQMAASPTPNVLPPKAKVVANLRLITGETMESARERLTRVISDQRVSVQVLEGANPSPCSPASGEAWERLKGAVEETWPEAVVSPYLMVAASDARHYAGLSEHVYRFSAMALSLEERRMIHGNNERIPLSKLNQTVRFYLRLITKC